MSLENDPVATQLYTTENWVTEKETIKPSNIIAFATMLMIAVQRLAKGRGPYKKQLVLTIMRKVIENDAPFQDDADRQAVLGLLESVVPPAIDGIKDVGAQLITSVQGAKCCC